jgi:hypothetical protein
MKEEGDQNRVNKGIWSEETPHQLTKGRIPMVVVKYRFVGSIDSTRPKAEL